VVYCVFINFTCFIHLNNHLLFIRKKLHFFKPFLLFLFIKCIEIYLVINFQFTHVSAITSIAGLTLLESINKSKNFFGAFILILYSLLRFKVLMLVLIITGLRVFTLDLNKNSIKELFKYCRLRIFFCSLLVIVIVNEINYFIYENKNNQENYLKTIAIKSYVVGNTN
jgi:hypothetical protein